MLTTTSPRSVSARTAAAVAVSAAAGAALLVSPATADAVPGLTGRSFVSTSVTPLPIPGGGPLKISFGAKDRVSLTAGCNQMGGTAKARGGRLHFSRLASTMMACPPPRNLADAWASNFAKKAPHYRVAGPVLTLSTPTTTVVLRETRR
ncbi:hypothetical protein GOARA_036_01630 [Gordonia araii NBRC 100433]|uniref:DUF306 domain-containing protein n=1 Tax=Gordonia araii NBRC 100433 TaxID=1073574 RepID=G7H0Q6_9ACTN|nr:META domain-containing protein [Gordonia araii]NNG96806.1 META domain-containing protein [Gordonia araii NBRC 100433]GAB09431.1 hypothetical protein GOARA_036_01630 [Gordonia araii NBRC 100433]